MLKMKVLGCTMTVVAVLILVFNVSLGWAQGESTTMQSVPGIPHNTPLTLMENVEHLDDVALFQMHSASGLGSALVPRTTPTDSPWSVDERVTDSVASTRGNPDIAVDARGNAYAIWADRRNGGGVLENDVYFAYRPANGAWGENERVNDDIAATYRHIAPAIAVDTAGNAYAVWQDNRSGDWDLYFSYRPAGGSWQTNVRVNDEAGTVKGVKTAIDVDAAGNAYAVWEDTRNNRNNIYFSYRPAGGNWSVNERVTDDNWLQVPTSPDIAVDVTGNAWVLWDDPLGGSDNDIYSRRRPSGGGWGPISRVNDDSSGARQDRASVAVDGDGSAYAVWEDYRGGSVAIYFSYCPKGGSWRTNEELGVTMGGAQFPDISADDRGNVYVAWAEIGLLDVYFSYRGRDGVWRPGERVNDVSYADLTSLSPQHAIATDSAGNAQVVWKDMRDAGGDSIYSAWRLSPSGPTLTASPSSVPADGKTSPFITLSNAPPGHRIRLLSSRGSVDVLDPTVGTVNSSGYLFAGVTSTAPGTTILTAQDLRTGEFFATSASVEFTSLSGPQPPPAQMGDIVITGIRAEHPLGARYLEGIPVPNQIDVTVDWRGTSPGRVVFFLNGVTHSKPAGPSGASHILDMGSDLQPGSNALRIVAYDASGQMSSPHDFSPHLAPMPLWIASLMSCGALGPMVLSDGTTGSAVEYQAVHRLPPGGVKVGAPVGPPGSKVKFEGYIGGTLRVPVHSNSARFFITGGVNPAIEVMSVEAGADIKAIGGMDIKARNGDLSDPISNGKVRVDVKAYGQKNWPVVIFITNFIAPGAAETMIFIPQEIVSIAGDVYLQGNLRGRIEWTWEIGPYPQIFDYKGFKAGLGPGIETGYRFDKFGVNIKVYVGAYGMAFFEKDAQNVDGLQFDEVVIRGEGGVTVKAFAWKRGGKYLLEWKYPSSDLQLVDLSGGSQSEWRLISHNTGTNYAVFQGGPGRGWDFDSTQGRGVDMATQSTLTNVLVSNVYAYPEPSLAVNPATDEVLLTWVHDDITKPVGQSHEISFSYWDGSSWSIPAGVTDDQLLDGTPQVAWTDDGNGVAIWARINDTLPVSATLDVTTTMKLEIAAATYSPTLGTWSPISLLTINSAMDFKPRLARNDSGDILAVWQQNSAGLLSGDSDNPDRALAVFYDSNWGTPTVAVDAIPGLIDLATGYGDSVAAIAYTRYLTPTGHSTPALQLFTSAWNGSSWSTPVQCTDDALGHRNPQVTYNGANQPLMVWIAGDELRLRNLTTDDTVSLILESGAAVDQFHIVQDEMGNIAAVFATQNGQRDLFLAFYDEQHNVWSRPQPLTNDRAAEVYPSAGLDSDGRLLMSYAVTAIASVTHTATISGTGEVITFTMPTEGQTDLLTLSHVFTRNLTLENDGLALSDDHPGPGDTVVLSATVCNSGDLATDNVIVSFYDGNPSSGGTLIGVDTLTSPLAGGFTATLSVSYTVPITGGARTLYAVADPSGLIAESNEADNMVSLAAFGPDLELAGAGVDYWGGSHVGLRTLIRNIGTTAAPTTTLIFYQEALTGTLVVTDIVPSLAAGTTITLTTPWNSGMLSAGDHPMAVVVNQDEFTETFMMNNAYTFTLEVRPDLMVSPYYLWTTSPTATNVVVTATVYNVGTVTATNVTVGFYEDDNLANSNSLFTQTIPLLEPGTAMAISGQVEGPLACTLHVYVDPQRAITETTRANNLAGIGYRGPCSHVYLPLVVNDNQAQENLAAHTASQSALSLVLTFAFTCRVVFTSRKQRHADLRDI